MNKRNVAELIAQAEQQWHSKMQTVQNVQIGCEVQVKGLSDKLYTGIVYYHDAGILVLESPESSWHILKTSSLKLLSVKKSNAPVTSISTFSADTISQRENLAIKQAKINAAKIGVNVSPEAQVWG